MTSALVKIAVTVSLTASYASPAAEMLGFFVPWIASAIQYLIGLVDYYLVWVIEILNHYIPGWKLAILSPFVITFFILPTLVIIYLYLSALALYVYRRRHAIIEGFNQHNVWEGYKKMMAALWSGHGWIWHGYEVDGLERIPNRGAALLVYYHGAIPIDMYYLNAHLYLEKNRTLCSVMDNFAFKIPGLEKFFEFWGCFPGPRDKVVEILRDGEMVSIAPGGVREALFSSNYSIVWGERQGFAKAALEAKVPIIPVFSENCRQAFDYIKFGRGFFRRMYERTRLPFLPLYGGFPVKIITHVGHPIYSNRNTTPSELVAKTKKQLEELIERHQRSPGSVFLSFLERFVTKSSKELEIVPLERDSCSSSEESLNTEARNLPAKGHIIFKCKRKDSYDGPDSEIHDIVYSCQCPECVIMNSTNLKRYTAGVDVKPVTENSNSQSRDNFITVLDGNENYGKTV